MKTLPARIAASALPLALLGLVPAPAVAQGASPSARPFAESRPIAGRYIVVFKSSVGNPAAEAANAVRGAGGQLHHSYTAALKGFAASLPERALAGLRNNPNIESIEQDQTIALAQVSPQTPATWGLDRIDQFSGILNAMYQFNYTGTGVHAFIIDTGIRPDHTEFTGRLLPGFSAISDSNGTTDCNGHGTHVAGTVGGSTWGVAKQVSLIPVRVLGCNGSGSWSGVIAGIDWAAKSTLRPAVANMSVGGGSSSSVNAAVAGAVAKGVTMVVAAGNNNADACRYSPSGEPSAITVGATAQGDARASYSNYGACVDLFAPGSSITSAWHTGNTATNTISGTSMATPHVAGVAALTLQANPTATPAAIANFLVSNSTAGVVTGAGTGSPNKLLYSLAEGTPVEPPPTVVAVQSITGRTVKISTRNWSAQATITIRDLNVNAVEPGVTVKGNFVPGATNVSCVTTNTGSCSVSSGTLASTVAATVFTVTSVSGTGRIYDPSQNSASQLSISKPR